MHVDCYWKDNDQMEIWSLWWKEKTRILPSCHRVNTIVWLQDFNETTGEKLDGSYARFGLVWFGFMAYQLLLAISTPSPLYSYILNIHVIYKHILQITFLNKPKLFLLTNSSKYYHIYNSHNLISLIFLYAVYSILPIDRTLSWQWRSIPYSPNLQGWFNVICRRSLTSLQRCNRHILQPWQTGLCKERKLPLINKSRELLPAKRLPYAHWSLISQLTLDTARELRMNSYDILLWTPTPELTDQQKHTGDLSRAMTDRDG